MSHRYVSIHSMYTSYNTNISIVQYEPIEGKRQNKFGLAVLNLTGSLGASFPLKN